MASVIALNLQDIHCTIVREPAIQLFQGLVTKNLITLEFVLYWKYMVQSLTFLKFLLKIANLSFDFGDEIGDVLDFSPKL